MLYVLLCLFLSVCILSGLVHCGVVRFAVVCFVVQMCCVRVLTVFVVPFVLLCVYLLGGGVCRGRCLDCPTSKTDSAYYMTAAEYANVAALRILLFCVMLFVPGVSYCV